MAPRTSGHPIPTKKKPRGLLTPGMAQVHPTNNKNQIVDFLDQVRDHLA